MNDSWPTTALVHTLSDIYTHFYLGKSLKLNWEKFRVLWTVLLKAAMWICTAHTHTYIYSMTKPLSLSGHCLPSPQTTMHVDCLLSFLIWPQTILHFISKSIKVFPQERFHANVDKRSTGLTAALCLWSDRKICSLWKNACHREGKSLNSEWNTVFIFHWTLKGKFTPFTNRDTKKWQTVSDFVNIFLRCQTWMRRDWLWK